MLKSPSKASAYNWKLFAIFSAVLVVLATVATSLIEPYLDADITTRRIERASAYSAFIVPCLAAPFAGWWLIDKISFLSAVVASSTFCSGWNIGVGLLSVIVAGGLYYASFRVRQFWIYSRLPDELNSDDGQAEKE